MSGTQRNDYYVASPGSDFRCPDNRVFGVIAAFHDDVGAQELDQSEGRVLGKNYHQINAFERSEHVATLGVASDRAGRTFQSADGVVAI